MDPQPLTPDQDRSPQSRAEREAAARALEEELLAARDAWRRDPNSEHTAAYEAALDRAQRLFDDEIA